MNKVCLNDLNGNVLYVGLNAVMRALSQGEKFKIIIATDADDFIKNVIKAKAKEANVQTEIVFSKTALGKVAKIERGASVIGIKVAN